jgi:4-hydroxy-tetrahydrodipicolinate synthase
MVSFKAEGAFTALVTPFSPDGSSLDLAAFERLIEGQIAGGITGLVPCGTTGEAPTLSEREQAELIAVTARLARGRASVLAGVGSNSTAKTISLAKAAVEAGADAVMVVMPYYNKPNQQGLVEHIKAVCAGVSTPVVLYNVPGRTAVSLSVEATLRILEACPQVVGVKDASNNVHYCQELLSRAKERVSVLCGDDALTVALMAVGADGVISVTSNVVPSAVAAVIRSMREGRCQEALGLHYRLLPLHAAMFSVPSPVPAKVVLGARGVMSTSVRLPLIAALPEEEREILAAVSKFEAA